MRRVKTKVPIAEAERRALLYLSHLHQLELAKPSSVGVAIWPGVNMASQGFAGAASRILKGLQKSGQAEWNARARDWGWNITPAGRARLAQGDQ